jgi:hypothetical protein
MIYFLIVVASAAPRRSPGRSLAALLLGIADVAGKYFIPKMGAFTVYLLMILILMWRPQGLFTRKGGKLMSTPSAADFQRALLRPARWRPLGVRGLGRWPSRCRWPCPRTRCWSTRSPSSRCSRCRST